MVWAPHPDDEALAAGLLIQATLRTGGAVRVVFLTDGDNNPWPQRWVERRWRIGSADRARWGARRRREALRSLGTLGAGPGDVRFLSYPDRGLTPCLLAGAGPLLGDLTAELRAWHPTLLVTPALDDLHPDHNATAVLARAALAALAPGPGRPAHLEYRVHGLPLSCRAGALVLRGSTGLRATKRSAIRCHASQLVLRRRSLTAFADRPEVFCPADTPGRDVPCRHDGGAGGIRVRVPRLPRPGAFGPATLRLLGLRPGGEIESRAVPTAPPAFRPRSRPGAAVLPSAVLDPRTSWFLKVERRYGFLDEAGWLRLVPEPTRREEPRRAGAWGP